jgi:GntR family transcriptional regulator
MKSGKTKTSPKPFVRLQTEISNLIQKTPPGERLISEPELAKQLGVSRATLREAMRTFEGQGLIRRRQGIGTFVVRQPQIIENGLEVLESIETRANLIGLAVSMGALDIQTIRADEEQAEALATSLGSPLIKIARAIFADGRPVAYLIDILRENVLTQEDLHSGFTGSVLDLLLKRGSPQLTTSKTEIRAVAAAIEIARALEIQRGDVLLMLRSQLMAESGAIVDFSYSYFLPGYFRFHVNRRVG